MSGYMNERFRALDPTAGFRLGDLRSPAALAEGLRGSIIGQDHAVDAVVRAMTIAAVGLRDPRRPIASLLLVGPTGVGKTELARQVAHHVRGDADNLCRIDMNSLAQEHYAASLSGAPPGYAGSKEQFSLFDREMVEGTVSRPGVVLFDEVEKAHPTVLRALLQIVDTGTLRLASGNSTIDFRNAIILLTSNLGSRDVHDLQRPVARSPVGLLTSVARRFRGGSRSERDVVLNAVRAFFDPELLNRFDEVITFTSLDDTDARRVVDAEVDHLIAALAARGVHATVTDRARTQLVDAGFDARYGARALHRVIRTELHAPIATLLATADGGVLGHVVADAGSAGVSVTAAPVRAQATQNAHRP
ncbi:AAA family ATPase [Williamsia sp. MIQD14]|uniref:AAA family ATPase n=1 Tax=Williamsia sp. MIQD14 TaxID=3425703 RepID=UPI003D9FFBD4